MATDQLINKTQGDAIIAGLTAIKNAINDQPVPTQVEDVVSDAFDVGVSYVPGDYCIYENKLYKCDVAHHGAWDGNDFTLTNVGAELDTLNNALNYKYVPITSATRLSDLATVISQFSPHKPPYILAVRNDGFSTRMYLNTQSTSDLRFGGCNTVGPYIQGLYVTASSLTFSQYQLGSGTVTNFFTTGTWDIKLYY